jgi:tetratricopeptide (TPR) repeat protein
MGQIQASLSLLYEDLGHPEAAMETARAALDTARRADDPYVWADALLSVAELSLNRADLDQARQALEQVDLLAGREGFQDVIAWARGYGGKLALAAGDTGRAVLSFEQALAAFQAQGQPVGIVWALRHLARAALVSDDLERAANLYRSAFEQAMVHVLPEAPLALLGMAETAVARGEAETGLVLLSASAAAAERMGLVLHPDEKDAAVKAENMIRWAVDSGRVDELAEQGRGMSLAEAAAYAFGPPSSSSL